jgi:tRNA G18 (ribose-2'-O)-methylase SpoU
MKKSGFYGIGIERGKNNFNYGTLFRTAQMFNADFLFVIGARFKHQSSDVRKSWRHVPTFSYNDISDFNKHRPYDCLLIGIEMLKNSRLLKNYSHPKRAIYLLGAEDHGLTKEAISICNDFICIPGEMSLNVSVAGSIVIYDRISKLVE